MSYRLSGVKVQRWEGGDDVEVTPSPPSLLGDGGVGGDRGEAGEGDEGLNVGGFHIGGCWCWVRVKG
jgi:hypothetical protein